MTKRDRGASRSLEARIADAMLRAFLEQPHEADAKETIIGDSRGRASLPVVDLFAGCGGLMVASETVKGIGENHSSKQQTEVKKEHGYQYQSQQYNYDEAGTETQRAAQQTEHHPGGGGGHHSSDYRLRRSGGGTAGIRTHVRHVCHISGGAETAAEIVKLLAAEKKRLQEEQQERQEAEWQAPSSVYILNNNAVDRHTYTIPHVDQLNGYVERGAEITHTKTGGARK